MLLVRYVVACGRQSPCAIVFQLLTERKESFLVVVIPLLRFFLTFASWQEAGEVRRVREAVRTLLGHTSAA